jgi:hypothetical protein
MHRHADRRDEGDKAMSQAKTKLTRRTLFAGAGTAGALAAVATALPRVAPEAETPSEAKPAPARGGGYQLTDHVKRYYKTTLI